MLNGKVSTLHSLASKQTVYGSVPDTLITCVFATLGGECGILGWIKTTKEKKQDRRWQLADMRREKEEAERIAQQTEEP